MDNSHENTPPRRPLPFRQLQAELLRIWEATRKTALYVTDSIDEAIVLADRILVMSARPGRIKDIVDVGKVFGRPRSVESVKSSPQYGELFGHIWGLLRDEVSAARQEEDAGVHGGSASGRKDDRFPRRCRPLAEPPRKLSAKRLVT